MENTLPAMAGVTTETTPNKVYELVKSTEDVSSRLIFLSKWRNFLFENHDGTMTVWSILYLLWEVQTLRLSQISWMNWSKGPKMSCQKHDFEKMEKQRFWLSWCHHARMKNTLLAVAGATTKTTSNKLSELVKVLKTFHQNYSFVKMVNCFFRIPWWHNQTVWSVFYLLWQMQPLRASQISLMSRSKVVKMS